jgi:hypothetical protein
VEGFRLPGGYDATIAGVTRDEWLAELAARLGTSPPSPQEADALLRLAAVAAHAAERTAAPLSAWLAARSGRSLDEVLQTAAELGEQP